jgi:competence protein ComEC
VLGSGAALALLCLIGARRPAACLAVAVLVPAGAWVGAARVAAIDRSPLRVLVARDVTVRGYVARRERSSFGVQRLRLRVTRVEGRGPARDLVQLRVPKGSHLAEPSIGDELVAAGTLELPRRRAGDSFDYAAYLRRNGVHAILRARYVERTGGRRDGPAGLIDTLRRRAEAGVSAGLDPPLGALARGMVLGEDEDISDATAEDFKRSGLAHVLAVSGQNVTLLTILAWPLLASLGLGRRARLAGVVALIAVYVPLTGAGPSIVRAGVMGAAGAVAALAGRPASRWYALLLAAAVTLAFDPRAWLDVGWQLSFAAVVGIFLLAGPLMRRLQRLPEALAAGAATTVAATLATAPLMSLHFGRVSLVSLFANLIALPAIAPIMWIGMLASAAAQAWLLPAELLNALNAYLLGFVSSVARWSARAPGAVWQLQLASTLGLACGYALVGAAGAAVARRGRVAAVAGIAALLLAAGAVAGARRGPLAPPAPFTATFLDVGQGDATLFQAPGASVLVDGGPPEADVVAKLRAHGVNSLDVVVLTHEQRDHEGGLEAVMRSLPVRLLIDGGAGSKDPRHGRIVGAAHARGTEVVEAAAGQSLALGHVRVQVLGPPADRTPDPDEDPNQHAAVLIVSFGSIDFFMPADAESDVTGTLPLRPVEVVKVAHHGSQDEGLRSLIERLRPEAAVIEVGAGNPYGHPAGATISTLARTVPHVFRTDRDGDVVMTSARDGRILGTETSGGGG